MAPKKPRKKTRSGKKLDTTTGKIAVPLVKRGEKGRAAAMTSEDKKAAVTTQLNTPTAQATSEQLAQLRKNTIETQLSSNRGPVAPVGTLKRGGLGRGAKGAQVAYPVVQKATHAALHHLNQAHFAMGAGLPTQEHFENFDAIHANIEKMDKQIHMSLGTAKHLIGVSAGKNTPELTQTQININRRLGELRGIHEENVKRTLEGHVRKEEEKRKKQNGS